MDVLGALVGMHPLLSTKHPVSSPQKSPQNLRLATRVLPRGVRLLGVSHLMGYTLEQGSGARQGRGRKGQRQEARVFFPLSGIVAGTNRLRLCLAFLLGS